METPKRGLGVSPALRMALLLILAGAFLLAGKAAAHDWPGGHAWDTSITTETSNGNTPAQLRDPNPKRGERLHQQH